MHPFITHRPKRYETGATDYDPLRQLACAVVVQAAFDYFWPRRDDSVNVRADAERFLRSADGQALIREAGRISERAIVRTLGGL